VLVFLAVRASEQQTTETPNSKAIWREYGMEAGAMTYRTWDRPMEGSESTDQKL
jgi:hypothetical protein